MTAIKSAYDVSGGSVRSDIITGCTYLDLQALLTTVTGTIKYSIQRRNSSSFGDNWIPIRSGVNKQHALFYTYESESDGEIINGLSGDANTQYSVYIEPDSNATGTLNLHCNTDGTIA